MAEQKQKTTTGKQAGSGKRSAAGNKAGSARQSAAGKQTASGRRLTSKQRRARRLRRLRIIYATVAMLILLLAVILVAGLYQTGRKKNNAAKQAKAAEIAEEEAAIQARRDAIAEAGEIAKNYDYDGAIALLQQQEGYDTDSELINAIAGFTAEKSLLEAKDPTTVPHIFYHSLIIDPSRTFDTTKWDSETIGGNNAWMTTIEEFDKITQQMYDNGWVLIRMRDLVTETTDSDGKVHLAKNKNLLLPPDKKPFVLSIDDWSYYHSYDDKGYGDKAVLDANGKVKIQYTDTSGNVTVGDYDVMPRLNTFLDAHPDGAYKGARGIAAMTGYNGVFGYRTDVAYKTHERLGRDQEAYLNAHPDFNYDKEIEEAKKIADAVKAEGWEFACHTWGHLSVTGKSVDTLRTDQEKWQNTVANITGPTDTIIFAHGADIGTWRDYDASTNDVYAYFKSIGYNFYANVDASAPYWVQIRDGYCRQGRIDCDGLQMWRHLSGAAKTDVLSQFFDVASVFDSRRPTPVSATGKS